MQDISYKIYLDIFHHNWLHSLEKTAAEVKNTEANKDKNDGKKKQIIFKLKRQYFTDRMLNL